MRSSHDWHARWFASVAGTLVLGGFSIGCSAAIDPAAITDAQTAVRVKTAIVNDAELGENAIEVRVARGGVILSGRVATEQQADRAVQISRAVDGVTSVRSVLQIGIDATESANPNGSTRDSPSKDAVVDDAAEFEPNPLVLAVGAAVGWSDPRAGALLSRFSVSPLFKLGWGRGLGPAVGLGWFHADVQPTAGAPESLSRVNVKPVMVGVGYTMASGRVSVSPSVVAGIAFNSLTVTDTGTAAGVPVEVDNSLVWRPGVSAWFDLGRRMTLNVSTGYVMTRLRITILEGGRLVKRNASGDTTLVHVGVAYRLF
jgi:hypothetical protein